MHLHAFDLQLFILTKKYTRTFQRAAVMMKIILIILASALTTAQAARLGLLRVDPYGPTKGMLASTEFGYTRALQEEDAF
jgi:hypothetical protein